MSSQLFNKLKTVILEENKIIKNDELINDLEKNVNLIPEEKTAVRKQIDILKQALEKLTLNDIGNSIYHLKIAKLKFDYFAIRSIKNKKDEKDEKGSFAKFIKEKVEEFEKDLMKIDNSQLEGNIKKELFNKAKQVFKDFLNGVIIKSYYSKNYDS